MKQDEFDQWLLNFIKGTTYGTLNSRKFILPAEFGLKTMTGKK